MYMIGNNPIGMYGPDNVDRFEEFALELAGKLDRIADYVQDESTRDSVIAELRQLATECRNAAG